MVLWVLGFVWLAQGELPPLGQVVPSVTCLADNDQRYALCLPSNYRPDRRWPLILCLEPMSRGTIPVQGFSEAAERWGYIVIGSLNSRNYDWLSTTRAVNALIRETETRYSVDFTRVIHAGFSGGARASCDLALMTGKAAGIIAFGAGFNPSRPPGRSPRTDFVGVIGNTDMNFREMNQLDRDLEKLGWSHVTLVFEGGHQWPAKPVFTQAVAWLELKWLASHPDVDQADRVAQLYADAVLEAERLAQANKPYEAKQAWLRIVTHFEGLHPIDSAKVQLERWQKDPAVQALERQKQELERKETRIARTLYPRIELLRQYPLDPGDKIRERAWWVKKASEFATLPVDPEEQLMTKRLQEIIHNGIWEVSLVALSRAEHAHALWVNDVSLAMSPREPGLFYTRAQALAGLEREEEAFAALGEIGRLGGWIPLRARTDPHLAKLKDRARLESLIQQFPPPK